MQLSGANLERADLNFVVDFDRTMLAAAKLCNTTISAGQAGAMLMVSHQNTFDHKRINRTVGGLI